MVYCHATCKGLFRGPPEAKKEKRWPHDSTYYGPDVLLVESHSSALQSCCLDTVTLSVL